MGTHYYMSYAFKSTGCVDWKFGASVVNVHPFEWLVLMKRQKQEMIYVPLSFQEITDEEAETWKSLRLNGEQWVT